jgi:hypothetical protein
MQERRLAELYSSTELHQSGAVRRLRSSPAAKRNPSSTGSFELTIVGREKAPFRAHGFDPAFARVLIEVSELNRSASQDGSPRQCSIRTEQNYDEENQETVDEEESRVRARLFRTAGACNHGACTARSKQARRAIHALQVRAWSRLFLCWPPPWPVPGCSGRAPSGRLSR